MLEHFARDSDQKTPQLAALRIECGRVVNQPDKYGLEDLGRFLMGGQQQREVEYDSMVCATNLGKRSRSQPRKRQTRSFTRSRAAMNRPY